MASYVIVALDGILRTTVEGDLDFDGTATVVRGVAHENAEQGRHLFVDLRGADGADLSFAEVHRLAQMLAETPAAFRSRIALLDTFREGFEKVQFFEASATHQGYTVHSFLDETAAIGWLEDGPVR